MQPSIMITYQQENSRIKEAIKLIDKQINRYAMARLLVIVLGGAGLFKVVQYEQVWSTILFVLLIVLLFLWLVEWQSRLVRQKENLLDDAAVVQHELDLLAGLGGIYANGEDFIDDQHPYTSDLDIFGPKSIYHQINRTATFSGKIRLADWLRQAASSETIRARQEAIQELRTDSVWCRDFQARLLFGIRQPQDYRKMLFDYLHKPIDHLGGRLLKIYVACCPFIMGGCFVASFFLPFFSKFLAPLFLFHLLLTMGFAGKITQLSAGLGKMGKVLQQFAEAFRLVERRKWKSGLINQTLLVQESGKQGRSNVSLTLKELGDLLNKLDYRLNVLVAIFLNGILLWDFRQSYALLEWRKKHGTEVLAAFDDVATLEALVSMAVLALNHENWTWPVLLEGATRQLSSKGLKHPLLPEEGSIANDYALTDHRIALITGSNMAGKSTFLRTVGTNMVLAFAGAPVAAKELQLTVMHLLTYMRIRDSLKESTSTFKAELNRLEMILKRVNADKQSFFLVDEMLRGTNSVDKYLGSKAIIEKLIAEKGVGLLATHDLQLAGLEEAYPTYLKNYHFDIQVINQEMLFDYKLKEGACTIFNASLLLKKIGIDISVS